MKKREYNLSFILILLGNILVYSFKVDQDIYAPPEVIVFRTKSITNQSDGGAGIAALRALFSPVESPAGELDRNTFECLPAGDSRGGVKQTADSGTTSPAFCIDDRAIWLYIQSSHDSFVRNLLKITPGVPITSPAAIAILHRQTFSQESSESDTGR